MKNIFFFLFFLSVTVLTGQNNTFRFSDSLRISLVTGSAGNNLYTKFGHSTVRVIDYKNGLDVAFNYGTFDFDAPGFYLNFLRGKLNYFLSIDRMDQVKRYYTYYQRSLIDQEILLDPSERQVVAQFLQNNYLPENRFYLYDFFYDNCATRIRDILETEVEGFSYEKEIKIESYTFRQMLDLYVGDLYWTDFGMDLILGYPTDKVTDVREQMFLPDYLAQNLTQYAKKDGKPLLATPQPINQVTPIVQQSSAVLSPLVIMSFLFILSVVLTFFAQEKIRKWFDRVFFMVLGLMGCIMLFMWFGTDHWTTTKNLNVMWANPLFLLLPFLKNNKWIIYLGLAGVAVVLLGWAILPQQFHIAFLPILLTSGIRLVDRSGLPKLRK
ncbi:MAG: DUF4105 domain-containing protein [Bacteroidota bacterium]